MSHSLILALVLGSVSVFLIYDMLILVLFGVPSSLSMTAYKLDEKRKGLKGLFTATLFLMAGGLLPAWLEISEGTTFQFLTFLSCAALMFVGATPNFLDKGVHVIHSVAAYSSAVFSLTWSFIYLPNTWLFLLVNTIIVIVNGILTKSLKSGLEYWLEMIAFYTIYTTLIFSLIM